MKNVQIFEHIVNVVTCLVVAALVVAVFAGCTDNAPAPPPPVTNLIGPTYTGDVGQTSTPALVEDCAPSIISLAVWAAQNGRRVDPVDRFQAWDATLPSSGSPVAFAVWQIEVTTQEFNIPPASAGGFLMGLEVFVPAYRLQVVRVRVAGVDSLHRQGPYSVWGVNGDTLAIIAP